MNSSIERSRNVPPLRFPEFKGEWEKKKLGEVAEISSGGTPSRTNPDYWNGNIPWVSTTLIDFNFIDKTEEYITEEGLKNSSAKLFPKGTLLMAMYGQGKTRGKVSILNIEASTNQACGAIITNNRILDSTFAFQNLAKRYDEIRDLSNQGGQENLSGAIIKGIEIFFPTLLEQTKIASFLTAVDEKIQALKKKHSLLEQYKKGVMQKLFSQELRFKDDTSTKLSAGNGKEFPEWEKKKLGEIGTFQTSSIDKLSKENEKEVFLVNYMNVYRHENINNETVKSFQIVTAKDNQIESCNLKRGDILFTPSSETPDDIGHSVVIFEDLDNAVFSYHLMRFRPSIEIDILYSHYFCNVPQVLKQLTKLATGSTRFTISVSSFSSIEINLPCLEEQTAIANFLSAIDEKINYTQTQITKIETWKKGLLQKMFC